MFVLKINGNISLCSETLCQDLRIEKAISNAQDYRKKRMQKDSA